MSHVIFKKWQYPMSIFCKFHVHFDFFLISHIEFKEMTVTGNFSHVDNRSTAPGKQVNDQNNFLSRNFEISGNTGNFLCSSSKFPILKIPNIVISAANF